MAVRSQHRPEGLYSFDQRRLIDRKALGGGVQKLQQLLGSVGHRLSGGNGITAQCGRHRIRGLFGGDGGSQGRGKGSSDVVSALHVGDKHRQRVAGRVGGLRRNHRQRTGRGEMRHARLCGIEGCDCRAMVRGLGAQRCFGGLHGGVGPLGVQRRLVGHRDRGDGGIRIDARRSHGLQRRIDGRDIGGRLVHDQV